MDIIKALQSDPNVCPIFQSGLGLTDAAQALALRRAAYAAALGKHDWSFEYSDCHRTWCAGRDELQRLRAERAAVDADGALWRKHMHESYRCEVLL